MAPLATGNRWLADSRPLVMAHRGHSSGAPEQTLAAFSAAVELGADMIEADVRRSSDGELVLLHDPTLDRTTDGHGRVAQLSLAQLRQLDAGGWFSAAFAGEPIPTLAELFDLADRRGVGLCLEAKGETAAEQAEVTIQVARRIAERGRLDRDVLASFDHDALAAAAVVVPGLTIAPDRLPERGASSAAVLIGQARRVGAEIIQHHHEDLTADVVAAVRSAGIAVWVWPPVTMDDVARAAAMGVDGLMGDDVGAIVSVVGARARDQAVSTARATPSAADW